MLEWLKRLVSGSGERSASNRIAKNRLTVVLVQDRAGLTSSQLDRFRNELIAVLEKYFVIDASGIEIDYKRQGDYTVLSISSPVLVRRMLETDVNLNDNVIETSNTAFADGNDETISLEVESSFEGKSHSGKAKENQESPTNR